MKCKKKYTTGGNIVVGGDDPKKEKKKSSGNGANFQMDEKTKKRLGGSEECKTGDDTPKCKAIKGRSSDAVKARTSSQRKKSLSSFATGKKHNLKLVKSKPVEEEKLTKEQKKAAKNRRPANPRFL